jgi:hypothetical protein
LNRYLIEIAAEMQLYESLAELSRERQYIVSAPSQEEAEEMALSEDRKNYGANRIILTSIAL